MAAGVLRLFNDLANLRLVGSLKDAEDFVLPQWHHQDKIPIVISFLNLNPDGGRYNPYSLLDISGSSFDVKIFAADGTTVLASQTVWTKDVGARTLSASLNLNTAAMATAFTGNPASIAATLLFRLTEADGAITTYARAITILRELNVSGTPVPVDGAVYLTEDQVRALFVKFIGNAGESITIKSADGTKQAVLYVSNDGEFKADVI